MAKLSISQLAAFTGKDRRTITTRLVALDYVEGEDNAHLYESALALAVIYNPDGAGKSLDDARRDLAVEQAALTRAKREEAQRTRIPLEVITGVLDPVLQAIASTLKAGKGKILDEDTINGILEDLRDVPARIK